MSMSSYSRLPHTLLDFTLARATARLHALSANSLGKAPAWSRHGHSAAALASMAGGSHAQMYPTPGGAVNVDEFSLYARRKTSKKSETALQPRRPSAENGPLSELEEKVLTLAEVANSKEPLHGAPAYSEDELLMIYEDLLAISKPQFEFEGQQIKERDQAEVDAERVQAISDRLLDEDTHVAATQLGQHHGIIISRLQEVAAAIRSARQSANVASTSTADPTVVQRAISPGILTQEEWISLVRTCARAGDGEAAKKVLQLIEALGDEVQDDHINEVLDLYAEKGEIESFEYVLDSMVLGTRSERQRDLHIKSYLRSSPAGHIPVSAITLLHTYESRGTPAPQKSYTRTIGRLLHAKHESARGHALALDLFAHMRYAAHPDPDVSLYVVMLDACGPRQGSADALRALDLWTEMTVDRRLQPTARAYSAVITACARSGERKYVHEAFRLAKEMLDAHRDAYGMPAFRPNGHLFTALLEGAKRLGDLGRVRWILAEMVRGGAEGDLNELVMTHVFHAYAAYRPRFRREMAKIVDKEPQAASDASQAASDAPQASAEADTVAAAEETPSPSAQASSSAALGEEYNRPPADLPVSSWPSLFAHIPPQSQPEIIREARILFSRVLIDTHALRSAQSSSSEPPSPIAKFSHVDISPRLLNAYISVYMAHAPFEQWTALWRSLFAKLGVQRNGRSYVEALERCLLVETRERRMATEFAEQVWTEWREIEAAWREGRLANREGALLIDARLVERANIAMIRMYALARDNARGLALVKDFEWHYPPGSLRLIGPKATLFSTRTVLQATRPLVRLTSTVDIPDDHVPPILTFLDLELLHHRLVAAGDSAGIRYVTGLCKTYQGSLRKRRDATFRAVPPHLQNDVRAEESGDRADEVGSYLSF